MKAVQRGAAQQDFPPPIKESHDHRQFDNLQRDALKAKAVARQHRASNNTEKLLRPLKQALELHCAAAAAAPTSKEKVHLLGAAAVLAVRLQERDLARNLTARSLANAPRSLKLGRSSLLRLITSTTKE
jgi:hypothetical protein